MKFPAWMPIMVVAVCLLPAGPVQAGRIYVQAHGGYSSLNLDDVNDAIDTINDQAQGKYLDPIGSGWDVGLRAGYALTPELGLALGFARLRGNSGFTRDGYLVEYDLPAELYEISLDYLPVTDQKIQAGAGATFGLIRSAASLLVVDPVAGEKLEPFSGAGFHFAGYGALSVPVARKLFLIGQGGYRHAMINEVKVDGDIVFNPDSVDDKLRFNYSGLFLRVGIKFQP